MNYKFVNLIICSMLLISACTNQRSSPQINELNIAQVPSQKKLEFLITKEIDNQENIDFLQFKQLLGSDDLSKIDMFADILLSTDNAGLLPNKEFNRVFAIAGDHQSDIYQSFALALSSFIIRKDFHCVRPVYQQYFVKRYNLKTFEQTCVNNLPINVTSTITPQIKLNIDPERVSAIHVLFAGSGEGIVSKFGHISLRLIVCPENDHSEQACNSNLFEHIVLGFRAHIDEFKIDPLVGLFGGYNSYLFAHDFMDTYQEYAIGEFREIYSVPLNMTKSERNLLLRNLIDIHWSFAGDYKFLTNNCSILMQKALLNSWPNFASEPNLTELYWRPDNFFNALTSSKLTEFSKLKDLDIAEQQGFYFSSTLPIYQQALESVNLHLTQSDYHDIDSYIDHAPIIRIKKAQKDTSYYSLLQQDKTLLSAQILLEELSVVRYKRLLSLELAAFFEKNDIKTLSRYMHSVLNNQEFLAYQKCLLMPVLAAIKPIKLKYGIPQHTQEELNHNLCESAKKNLKQIRLQLHQFSPEQWRLVERAFRYWIDSMENVETYIKMESM